MNPASKPNIIFIFSDQQHWQAWGGADEFFNTPAMDAFARDSVVFSHAFCTTPQCSPSRSSLLTGLYPSRTGIWGNCEPGRPQLEMPTIAKALKAGGYRTAYFGKWHLGSQPIASEGWDTFDINDGHGAEIRRSGKHPDELATQKAVDWLRAAKAATAGNKNPSDGPVALFLSLVEPHDIYRFSPDRLVSEDGACEDIPLPPSWYGESFNGKPAIQQEFMRDDQGAKLDDDDESAWKTYRYCYRDNVANYDRCLGRMLETLEQLGYYDDSVITVTSDHGDMDTAHKLIFKGPFMYENMLRVPLMIRLPESLGGVNGRQCDFMTINTDLPTTLLDVAGLPKGNCEGISLLKLLKGEDIPQRDFVVSEYYRKQQWINPIRTIRTGQYKCNLYRDGNEEFYDLESDPHELQNLAASEECPKQRDQLSQILNKWISDRNDPYLRQCPTYRDGTVKELH